MTPAAAKLKALEEQLAGMHKRGNERDEYVGGFGGGHLHAGSFAEVEKHEAERKALAQKVKDARAEFKAERKELKGHAATFNDPSVWTKSLLAGDDVRFEKADDGIERELAQATYGLVSAADFKETKERLERKRSEEHANAAEAEARQREEAEAKKRRKKQKQRQQQASKLSFDDDVADEVADEAAATSVEPPSEAVHAPRSPIGTIEGAAGGSGSTSGQQ